MNLVGRDLTVLGSADPSKVGRRGVVVLDTARTLMIESDGRAVRVEKAGSLFEVSGASRPVAGSEVSGRLEDRLGVRAR